MTLHCWNCQRDIDDLPLPLSRHEFCAGCGEALHCCRQCLYFNPAVASGCEEDRAEVPSDREGANFCEFFKPVSRSAADNNQRTSGAASRLDLLFDDGESSGSQPESGNPLDDLFDD